MSQHELDPDLTRPTQNGVYFVDRKALERLAHTAEKAELHLCCIDLTDCLDKNELMRRLAVSLHLPASFGGNWDALADCLRDLGWLPAWGHVLLFDGADAFRRLAADDFAIWLGILDDAATFGGDHERPWFAFIALPELDDEVWDAASESFSPLTRNPMKTMNFELHGDYVEINMLLKLVGLCDSGGAGKQMVASGAVMLDGQIELRKTCKIHAGQVVGIGDVEIHVLPDPA